MSLDMTDVSFVDWDEGLRHYRAEDGEWVLVGEVDAIWMDGDPLTNPGGAVFRVIVPSSSGVSHGDQLRSTDRTYRVHGHESYPATGLKSLSVTLTGFGAGA